MPTSGEVNGYIGISEFKSRSEKAREFRVHRELSEQEKNMALKTMELTISETLFRHLERAARLAGVSTSDFVERLLDRSLSESLIAELERQEVEAYRQHPVVPGEFDVWENEQIWGDV
jgi:hypothetical protein